MKAVFSRVHYRLVARIIRDHIMRSCREPIAMAFAKAFAEDNPRFNREKFIAACLKD